ncbi:MAG TPA: hypothetical protein VNX88_05315 [Terriglobales bacterium]|jgi:hypothetical protein|nr:hypothetical protein [Terriglobales bacterium]
MRRIASLLLFSVGWICATWAQIPLSPSPSRIPIPEAGFVSPGQYTNSFFGFSLPLPKDRKFQIQDLSDSDKALEHSLFAYKSASKGLTLLIASATQVFGPPDDEAQKAVYLSGMQGQKGAQAISIGGRLFWKAELEEKTFSGKLRRLRYATGVAGYVILFSVSSYNSGQTDALRDCIESVKFFAPARAAEIAGSDSRPYLPSAAKRRLENAPQLDLAHLERGSISGNVYSNPTLGFGYQLPEGWYADLQNSSAKEHEADAAAGDSTRAAIVQECTKTLLSATEATPADRATGSSSRITILAADPTCFAPDLKYPDSVRDSEALQHIGQAIVRGFAGTSMLGREANRLRAIELAGHLFLEMPSASAIPVAGSTLLRKVHKSFVLTNLQQYWVIWLFECDTPSELERIMKASISFAPPRRASGPGGQ